MTPAPQRPRRQTAWRTDLPSLAFLAAVVVNTTLLAATPHTWLRALLVLPQALLLLGVQEAKHLCMHRSFLSSRRLNDAVGIFFAALFCVNFVGNRHFHFQHHRDTCNATDPEGQLYGLSWNTRWIWLLAPIELPWVAWHINRIGTAAVPPGERGRWRATFAAMFAIAAAIAGAAWYAPQAVLWAYLIPLALFTWLDFPLTQAEHYDATVLASTTRRDAATLTLDIVLPLGLGWVTLHRGLHRAHHRHPGLHWSGAARRLREDATAAPISYAVFVRRWLAGGPRLWRPVDVADRANGSHLQYEAR